MKETKVSTEELIRNAVSSYETLLRAQLRGDKALVDLCKLNIKMTERLLKKRAA
jgi:hypothetical protein